MGLHILYSDRIEDLAKDLTARLIEARRQGDAFSRLSVTVPNPNLGKWLQLKVFAKEEALCAGIDFPFMEQRLTGLLVPNLKGQGSFELLGDHSYSNRIAEMLIAGREEKEFAALSPFRGYVTGDDGLGCVKVETKRQARMVWDLAVKLADLMDSYEVRRPDILESWLKGENAAGKGEKIREGSVEAGEVAIARRLWGEDGYFPEDGNKLSLKQLYDRVKGGEPVGPKQEIYFFGHSTLSILQARILKWLAKVHEVYFYHNDMCLEYWGDIETKVEKIRNWKQKELTEDDLKIENKLLNEWGVAGRETLRLLVDLEEEVKDVNFEWEQVGGDERDTSTVLGKVQWAICHRTSAGERIRQDASLQVVGVPGIRREVEMVYNSILGSVWKPEGSGERPWSDCTFSDIAILVPDMATYRGVIESVFDARGQVPYGLIDSSASEESAYLAGFRALIDFVREGLTRRTLFALLGNRSVQAALKFSGEDVEAWRGLTEEMGAFDGFEGDGESRFNWAWGFARVRLGKVAEKLEGEEVPLIETGDDRALKFSEVVEFLHLAKEELLKGEGSWEKKLEDLMEGCLAVPEEGKELEESVRQKIVSTLRGLGKIQGEKSLEFAVGAVETFVGALGCRRGGYLTHGVTIAGLMPMRPVPFKQVYILGLGAAGFPGRTQESELDMRGMAWHMGDVTMPNQRKYLFLETLMAVRERLVISYVNKDLVKDEKLFSSSLVGELENFVSEAILEKTECEDGTIVKTPFREVEGYPLLERDGAVVDVAWRKEDAFAGIVPTYSKVARQMFMGAGREGSAAEEDGRGDAVEGIVEWSAKDLAAFLGEMLRAMLKGKFGIREERYEVNELDEDSPLGIGSGSQMRELEGVWLAGGDLDAAFRGEKLRGRLRGGFLGEFAKGKFEVAMEGNEKFRPFIEGFRGEKVNGGERGVWECEGAGAGVVRLVEGKVDWIREERGLAVLMARGIVDDGCFPGSAIEVLMSFLIRVASEGCEAARVLRVGVLDMKKKKACTWVWEVRPQEARDYLKGLVRGMREYWAGPKDGDGKYVNFEYAKLCRASQAIRENDWAAVVEKLGEVRYNEGQKHDHDLAVEEAVKRYERLPTAKEIEGIYAALYRFIFEGKMEEFETEEERKKREEKAKGKKGKGAKK
jgi:exonuclease V gamma subunit